MPCGHLGGEALPPCGTAFNSQRRPLAADTIRRDNGGQDRPGRPLSQLLGGVWLGTSRHDITRFLQEVADGDPKHLNQLYELVYDELSRIAWALMKGERPDHTLEPAALVNEAYLRLIDQTRTKWKDRVHFFAVAATQMRRVLKDHAKRRARQKRGGDRQKVPLAEDMPVTSNRHVDLVALEEALKKLEAMAPEDARIVEMRFFGGMTEAEIAAELGMAERSVRRGWRCAKTWLKAEISKGDSRFGRRHEQ